MQLERLLKKIRGKDARAAYRAIAQLRFPHDASAAATLASYKPKDEQRRFQYALAGIVLQEGTLGLARRWFSVGSDEQRRDLLHEIAQFWNEWASEGTVELAIAALDERDDKVRAYALIAVKAAVTIDSTQKFVTPERRVRIMQALVRAMARHDERPLGLFWLEKYVELLGLVGDESVLERLEKLRAVAGASRRTTIEKLEPAELPPGVPVPVVRVWDRGTGLLEIKTLETALERIRSRRP